MHNLLFITFPPFSITGHTNIKGYTAVRSTRRTAVPSAAPLAHLIGLQRRVYDELRLLL